MKQQIVYSALAAAMLYGADTLGQQKLEFCPALPKVKKEELISEGSLSNRNNFETYRTARAEVLELVLSKEEMAKYGSKRQALFTVMFDKNSPQIVQGYTITIRLPVDPEKPDGVNIYSPSIGCIKTIKEFRKTNLGEVVEKLSR
jgi:hypothetical protein